MSDWSARSPRVNQLMKALTADTEGRDVLIAALDKVGYSIFRQIRLEALPVATDPARRENAETGVILDVETTGLDDKKDEIIQLSMQKILFDDDGIIDYLERFDRLNEPSGPIPVEVTKITGITDEMVKGEVINESEVRAFTEDVTAYIAFNSGFDRKFCEKHYPASGFDEHPWFCAWAEVDWDTRSPGGTKLENLVLREGHVFGAHNAMNDVLATAFMLSRRNEEGLTAFSEMLEAGRQESIMVIAKGSTFSKKDLLKDRGYKFTKDGEETDGYKNCWYTNIPTTPEALEAEAEFLKEFYEKDITLPAYKVSPFNRYSTRGVSEPIEFRTFEAKTLSEKMDMPQSHSEFSF